MKLGKIRNTFSAAVQVSSFVGFNISYISSLSTGKFYPEWFLILWGQKNEKLARLNSIDLT